MDVDVSCLPCNLHGTDNIRIISSLIIGMMTSTCALMICIIDNTGINKVDMHVISCVVITCSCTRRIYVCIHTRHDRTRAMSSKNKVDVVYTRNVANIKETDSAVVCCVDIDVDVDVDVVVRFGAVHIKGTHKRSTLLSCINISYACGDAAVDVDVDIDVDIVVVVICVICCGVCDKTDVISS